jgi:hypothetical protein
MPTSYFHSDFDLSEGATRKVLLFPTFVIKIAKGQDGVDSNKTEYEWNKLNPNDKRLCPIIYADPFGFFVVMKRAQEVDDFDELWEFIKDSDYFNGFPEILIECVAGNFGFIDGVLVLTDYGGTSYSPYEV